MSAGRLSSKLASKKNLGTQPTPTSWVRDPNWLALPDITGQQKFVGLYAIFEESNYIALSATTSAGTYTVDWGDGSSTVASASGVQANYLYDYASVPGSPITHNGLTYKQVIVTVTPTTANLTVINLNLKNNASTGFGGLSAYDSSWLDISVNGVNLSTITISGASITVGHRLLESATIGQHSGSFGNYSYMFNGCVNLRNVSISSSSSNVTNTGSMFSNCYSLTTVPLFNTASVTSMSSMFLNCSALTTVPLFNTASVAGMNSMFSGCYSLTSVPLFNTASVTNMSTMFNGCWSLTTVPLFNTASVTTMSSMLSSCTALTTVPLFNTASVTTMGSMFASCSSLTTVPLFNTASVTTMASMFAGCPSLTTVPLFNTASVTTMGSMFASCSSLTVLPALSTTAVTNATTNIFLTCVNLSKIAMTGFKVTFSVTALKLSKTSLELLFSNLGIGTSQTLTITTNPGADTAVSLTGSTTAQSTTITMASTAGLSTGMSVSGTGTGITTGAAVTFQDTGDTVTLASHGLSNGDMVSFSVITTTTGIVINTVYYVISATTNTFQVSATSGGSALALTNNGSGTLKYNAKIVTINTNVSVVLDRPAATTAAGSTLAFRILNTSQATLRGWAITG